MVMVIVSASLTIVYDTQDLKMDCYRNNDPHRRCHVNNHISPAFEI
jgi:hypothetical protein